MLWKEESRETVYGPGRSSKSLQAFCLLLNKTSCALVHSFTYKETQKNRRGMVSAAVIGLKISCILHKTPPLLQDSLNRSRVCCWRVFGPHCTPKIQGSAQGPTRPALCCCTSTPLGLLRKSPSSLGSQGMECWEAWGRDSKPVSALIQEHA